MAEVRPRRGSAATEQRLFIGFSLLLIAAVIAATGYTLYRTRHEALDKHRDATAMQARSAEGYLTQSVDLAALTIEDVLAGAGGDSGSANLERAARTLPFVRSFSLADADGRIWASSNPENVGGRVLMDHYLPPARENGEFLRFGLPWSGRDFADGREITAAEPLAAEALTFIPIARPAVAAGRPVVVLVALNPDYFLNHFTQDEEALGATLEVLRLDGRLLLSTDPTDRPGSAHGGDSLPLRGTDTASSHLHHDYAGLGATLTAKRYSRRYPMVVTVHLPEQQALKQWQEEARSAAILAGVSALSILVLCGAIVRRLRRTAREEARASAQLDLAAKVFESADEAIMVSDPLKRIISVNPAFERVTGYSADEVMGHTAHVIFPDPRMQPVFDRIVRELDEKGSWQGEVVTRHKDGHPIYEWLTLSTVRDAGGKVMHFVGFLKDITKLKSVEDQVRKLSLAVEQSPSSIVITDLHGRIEYVNRCFTEVSGYSREEAIGGNPRMLQSGHTPPETYAGMWTALAAGQSWQGEFVNRRKDGSEYVEHATISPVRQPDGRITHYLAVKHDITDGKRLEQALRDNESRLRLALEGLGDGVWDWDVRSGRVYFSPHWLEMLGYREEDLPPDIRAWARLIHPDDRESNRALLDAHLHNETPLYGNEYRLRTKGGDWKWILVRGAVISRAGDGSPLRMLGTHVDISHRKILEASLIAATQAAEAANRAKSEFLANMSHEIRTPMNAILGLTDLMMDSAAGPEQRGYLELVHQSASDLLTIINEILDFSKVEAGMLQMDEVDFGLRQCIDAAVAPLSARARDKGLRLAVAVAAEVPFTVHGDPVRLRQVLINLIGNAIKFTDHGEIDVRVAPLADDAAIDQILFSVADTGIGIPADKQEMVFEAFSQADASTTRRFGGTGLGLPISRRIVERMGGRMWVESRVGQGSTFYFSVTLPPAAAAARAIGQPAPAALAGAGPGRSLDVLLAEDNVVNQKLAVAMLTRLGHKATVVGDGAAAVALVQQRRFDAILMDVQMPHMSGIDATRAIRAYEARLGIRTPIIAMTANAFAEDRDRCIEAGMDEYLSKPVARELLAGTLARLCALPAGAPPATSAPPPAAAPPDPPQFQRETTLQSLAGDAELLAELATIFIATCSGQLESLKQAAGRDDWAAVAQIAHSLKGGAAVFGALRCVSAARQVEALARAEDAATHAALAELETAARGLVDELRQSIDVRAAETP